MRKPNYRFERRTRELEKQAKKARKAEIEQQKAAPEDAKDASNKEHET